MVITDTGTGNTEPTNTTASTREEYYEGYKTKCYEENLDAQLLKEEQIESKQGWFVPKSIIGKHACLHSKVKRTIRNCLPRKIRIN